MQTAAAPASWHLHAPAAQCRLPLEFLPVAPKVYLGASGPQVKAKPGAQAKSRFMLRGQTKRAKAHTKKVEDHVQLVMLSPPSAHPSSKALASSNNPTTQRQACGICSPSLGPAEWLWTPTPRLSESLPGSLCLWSGDSGKQEDPGKSGPRS